MPPEATSIGEAWKVLTAPTKPEKEKINELYKALATPTLRQRVPIAEWHASFKFLNEYVAFVYDRTVRPEIRRLRRSGLAPPNVGMVLRLAFNKLIVPNIHAWEVEKPGVEGIRELLSQIESIVNYYLEHPKELENAVKELLESWYGKGVPVEEYVKFIREVLKKMKEKLPQLREEYIATLKARGLIE